MLSWPYRDKNYVVPSVLMAAPSVCLIWIYALAGWQYERTATSALRLRFDEVVSHSSVSTPNSLTL